MAKTIVFFGGDSQVGTSMISQSVSEILSGNKRVIHIMGSGKLGNQYFFGTPGHSLDELRASVISGKVSYEDICPLIEKHHNLDYIPSVNSSLEAKYFPENTFQLLKEHLEGEYDYIVIDAGDNFNLGLTISAMNCGNIRYCVTTQQAKSIYRLEKLKKLILEPLNWECTLIVNKYIKDPSLLMEREIGVMVQMSNPLKIPYMENGWQAEIDGNTLLHYHGFTKAIKTITADIGEGKEKKHIWLRNLI